MRRDSQQQMLRRPRGVTYLEMIVVIAILTLLAASLVGGLRSLRGANRLHSSVEAVANTISLARSRAIGDNAIYHVRVLNRGFNDQHIQVYHFPRTSHALRADDEEWVQSNGGWNSSGDPETLNFDVHDAVPNMFNYRIETKKLAPDVVFETYYDPGVIWQKNNTNATWKSNRNQAVNLHTRFPPKKKKTDPDPYVFLFYTGKGNAGEYKWLKTTTGAAHYQNLVPKVTPNYVGPTPSFPAEPKLLYFFPDGSASGNLLFLIRSDKEIRYVQVLKGGIIRTGHITRHNKLTDSPDHFSDFRDLN